MGHVEHDMILVEGYRDIHAAHAIAVREMSPRFTNLVGPIVPGTTNGAASFVVHTSGSKTGWDTAEEWEACAAAFMSSLGDANLFVDAIQIRWGGDREMPPRIVRSSDPEWINE